MLISSYNQRVIAKSMKTHLYFLALIVNGEYSAAIVYLPKPLDKLGTKS